MSRLLGSFLALLLTLSSAAFAEAPPAHLFDITGSVHGGFDRVGQIARRADGRIYIADGYHHRVVVYDENGRYLEQIGSLGTALGQFNVSGGLAFDQEGNLYVAESEGNRITKLSPSHLPLMTFGSVGTGPGQLHGPTNLAFSPDGSRLYVTELFNDRVSIFDTSGTFVSSFGSSGTGPGQFDFPFGIAVDSNGNVIVADELNNRVQRFDANGSFLGAFGGLGTAPGQFHFVVGLALDGDGNLYATDQLNNRVQKLRPDGTVLSVWGTFGSGPGQMYNPWAVLPLPNGQIWVGDTFNHRISVYGPGSSAPLAEAIAPEEDGRPQPPSGQSGSASSAFAGCQEAPPVFLQNIGGFDRVHQIVRRDDGRIYVGDAYHNRVVVYSESGVYLEQIGSFGSALGQFNLPAGLAFDDGGNLHVAEQGGDRITKLSSTNLPLLTFGSSGGNGGPLDGPTNLATSPDRSRVYVTEFLNDRISVYGSAGNFIGRFGSTGTGPAHFDHPFGIVVDSGGEVFVADEFNNRIQHLDADGHYLAEFGGLGSAPGQLHFVVGLGLDADGNLFATDQLNNRVQKFRRDGTPLVAWGTFGNGPGQMYNPWAVLPLPNGQIWVGDTFNYRISIYGPGGPSPSPEILSILDIPDDDGFQVRIHLQASSLDVAGSPTPITQYEVFRRIDSAPVESNDVSRARASEVGSVPARTPALSSSILAPTRTELAGWDFVAALPAHAEPEYSMVVPTLVNSTPDQTRYSVFFVRAATSQPAVFYDSCTDSGYSLDNHSPAPPVHFEVAASAGNGDLVLAWDANEETDFHHYSLYRGADANFVPGDSNKLADLFAAGYTDHGESQAGGGVYYKLCAVDVNENASGFVTASTENSTDVPGGGIPAMFALHPIRPNPIVDQAIVGFDLPIASVVSVRVLDVSGRLVRVLGDSTSLPAGRYQWQWDGRGVNGARVRNGVYFVRLQSAHFSGVRTLVIAN